MKAKLLSNLVVAIILVVAFIFEAYHFGWSGTGFLNKTLWDWLQLLIIPLALAVVALVFQLANNRTERQIAKERYEQDQQIALDKQHEDLLQTYLDRISELLLKESLRTSPSEEVRNVARVRTITVLTQLDARRISYVFGFLQEAGLMSTTSDRSVVSLKDADLRKVKWSYADLSGADLSGARLNSANLSGANLSGANLSGADLSGADLSGAILVEFKRREANFSFDNLFSEGNLDKMVNLIGHKFDLNVANLKGASLIGTDLTGATLIFVNFSFANLTRAILAGTVFIEANLKDVIGITNEELEKKALLLSLKGATMPDGSLHDE